MTPSPITTKEIAIDEIVIDLTIQVRAKMDEATVERYAEAMKDGDKFPNIVVYAAKKDAETYLLSDGAHRLEAAKRIGSQTLRVEVHMGGRSDALKYALSANYSHGLHRSNEDKRICVNLALAEWPNLSDREISKICGVGNALVGVCRRCLNQTPEQPAERIGGDGKTYTVKPTIRESRTVQSSPDRGLDAPKEATNSGPAGEVIPPAPEPRTLDKEFTKSIGIDSAVNWFASQVEDVAAAIIDDASDEQLAEAVKQWGKEHRRLGAALTERNRKKAALNSTSD